MFDVKTTDPGALRRSIRLGWMGIAGSLALLLWNAAMLYSGGWRIVPSVFIVVALVLLTAFAIRTSRARRRLDR